MLPLAIQKFNARTLASKLDSAEKKEGQMPASSTPDGIEAMYKQYHSTAVCGTDWMISVVAISLCIGSVVGIGGFWPKLETGLVYAACCALGLGPIHILLRWNKAMYTARREWVILNTYLWAMVRFRVYLSTMVPMSNDPEASHTMFLTKALIRGPHNVIFLLGLGYPLRVQAAFPLTCLSAVLATLSACLTHSELLASASSGPYLATLEGFACRGFYGDFVFFTTGAPCTSDNVLLNIWCAESGAAVLALLLYTFFQESSRRKRFFATSGLQEPYPVFWGELWQTCWMTVILSVVTLTLHALLYSALDL